MDYSAETDYYGLEEVIFKIKNGLFDATKISDARGNLNLQRENENLSESLSVFSNLIDDVSLDENTEFKMLHAWCCVKDTTGHEKMGVRGPPAGIDPDQKITCYTHRSNGRVRVLDYRGTTEEEWKRCRSSIVHVHFPLQPILPILAKLERPNQTLLNSVLPLGITSKNLFMTSGDFYVDETRQKMESKDDDEFGGKSKWNDRTALSIYHLHGKSFKAVCDWAEKNPELGEDAVLQALPTNPSDWFNWSVFAAPTPEQLMEGEYYSRLNQNRWCHTMSGEWVSPQDILIPTIDLLCLLVWLHS